MGVLEGSRMSVNLDDGMNVFVVMRKSISPSQDVVLCIIMLI